MANRPKASGGFHSIAYTVKQARKSGSYREFYKHLRSQNVCKACALGQKAMKNEVGEWFQVCKKAMQAIAQDLLGGIEPEFFATHSLEDLSQMRGSELEAAGRLMEPMIAREGDTHFTTISWEEAYEIATAKLQEADPDRTFFYTSGRSSNEAAFLVQLLARQFGSNNVNNCSYYCHQASGVGLKASIGSGTATVTLEDMEDADMVVVIGANPSSNHPRMITHLVDVRRRGGYVAVVNPFVEVGLQEFKIPSRVRSLLVSSTVSDLYIQPHCGGDMAFLKAICVKLVEKGDYNEDYVTAYCDGWEELKTDLENSDFEELLLFSGVSRKDFDELYAKLVSANNVIFSWAMGLTHQQHGTETIRMLANIQLLLGNIGKKGAGLLPLRGHSNVQGVGSVGVVPKLSPVIVEGLATHLNITVPDTPGLDTFACMMAADRGDIDFAIQLGGNLLGSNPDTAFASRALSKIPWTVQISTTLNKGHLTGRGKNTLVLPVRVRDEEKQETSQESMFNYVRMSVGGFDAPHPLLPSEVELFTHVAQRLYGNEPVPWKDFEDHNVIRDFISRTIPYLSPLKDLTPKSGEFTIPGRIKHTPEFDTDTGKGKLFVGSPPDGRPEEGTYNLMTFRSEGQFNTIVYEEEDAYRGTTHRDVLFVSERDLNKLNLNDGDWVTVKSQVGQIRLQMVEAPIRPGNLAMYFPEGNVLVPPNLDPLSKT
ncbi:MAG: FdhF/YdeP family oxidoreductase, partial [Candidatus Kariarchaeaceae archaeon]